VLYYKSGESYWYNNNGSNNVAFEELEIPEGTYLTYEVYARDNTSGLESAHAKYYYYRKNGDLTFTDNICSINTGVTGEDLLYGFAAEAGVRYTFAGKVTSKMPMYGRVHGYQPCKRGYRRGLYRPNGYALPPPYITSDSNAAIPVLEFIPKTDAHIPV
jgi:hypothetical protein